MAQKTAARPDFHATVELEMRRRSWGLRTLAKALAGDGASHERIENERRAVRRWLGPAKATPSPANRRRVAVALGIPEHTFDDPDDEEEAEDLDAQVLALARDTAALNRRASALAERVARKQAPPRDLAVVNATGLEPKGL